MAQPSYPPFASFPQPTNNPMMDQPTYDYNHAPVPQPTYPPVPQPMTQSTYPPVSQPNFLTAPPATWCMTQPTYPPTYPPVQEPTYPPTSQPTYPPVTQPSYTSTEQPSHTAITKPIPVLGPQYCLPHLVDLAIVRKLMTLTDDFVVTDVNKNVMFKVKGKFLSLHDKRVLLDAAGKTVITLRQKILSAHSRWHVFRGGSSDPRDLIFTAKTSSLIQFKTKLNVYLANRTSEDVSDFKVEGSWSERSCVIYVGESTTIAAQMHKKETAQSIFLGKDTFMVTVYPNIDYAFVVALIVILDAINSSDSI